MERNILIAKNLTAFMQLLLRQVSTAHFYWCADRIPIGKLPAFIDKWEPCFRLRADAPARAYRKRTQRASVHLSIHPDYLKADAETVAWWMLSTPGKEGLATSRQLPGRVFDARTAAGRLHCGHYELLEQPKTFVAANGRKQTETTWTWRLTPTRYREWEALLVQRAKAGDRNGVAAAITCLREMPMFAGVRSQVARLLMEANRMLRKVGLPEIDSEPLPTMRMLALWADGVAL